MADDKLEKKEATKKRMTGAEFSAQIRAAVKADPYLFRALKPKYVTFHLVKEDHPLIEAAIRLGEWIFWQQEVTPEERAAIRTLQGQLKRLPSPLEGYRLDYGVTLEFDLALDSPETQDLSVPAIELSRGWHVSIWTDPSRICAVDIFSIYSLLPDLEDARAKEREKSDSIDHELDFYLKAGQGTGDRIGDLNRWVSEVDSLDEFRAKARSIEIETYFKSVPEEKP